LIISNFKKYSYCIETVTRLAFIDQKSIHIIIVLEELTGIFEVSSSKDLNFENNFFMQRLVKNEKKVFLTQDFMIFCEENALSFNGL
jgi:hypothetical protein